MVKTKAQVVDFSRHKKSKNQMLRRLFDEHRSSLRTFLLGRMGNTADVDDVMQDVFVRLARMPDLPAKMEKSRGSIRAYILTIANNRLVDISRHKKVQQHYLETEQPLLSQEGEASSPDRIAQGREQLELIRAAIAKLKPMEQKAFVLSRFKYMSYREISENLGVSPRTVEDYIGNALMKIRKAVAKASGGKR